MKHFTRNYTFKPQEAVKMMELLRRVYEVIEMDQIRHEGYRKLDKKGLKDGKYPIEFPKVLGDHIFNYLQVKDQLFRDIVIRRQKRYRRRQRKSSK